MTGSSYPEANAAQGRELRRRKESKTMRKFKKMIVAALAASLFGSSVHLLGLIPW